MCADMWFEFLDGLFRCQNLWCMGGECDNKEGDLKWEHPVPRVSGYKRRSDVKEGDITEVGAR